MDEKKKFEMWRRNCGYITEDAKGIFWECWQAAQDAVTRSAGDGEYSCLSWGGHNIRGNRDSVEAVKSAIHQAGTVPELKDEIAALLKRIAGDGREPVRARSDGFRDCITAIKGAIAFGQQDTNPPPEGHWLAEFWEIGNKRIAGEGREAVELRGVAEAIAEGRGSWVPCTGCYDTEDGRPTQRYAHSEVLGCELGCGCSECGAAPVAELIVGPDAQVRDIELRAGIATTLAEGVYPLVIAAPQAEPVAKTVDELAMLVRQLVHSLRKSAPDNDLSNRAVDYLRRHGLQGSVLRAAPAPSASPAALTDEQRVSAAKAMASVFLGFEMEREPGNLELRAVDAVIRSLAAPHPSGT